MYRVEEEGEPPEAAVPAAAAAAERVSAAVEAVAAAPGEYRNAYRRQLQALSRRVRLLGPFVEELRERRGSASSRGEDEVVEETVLAPLAAALEAALGLLRLGREGSRISLDIHELVTDF